MKVSSIWFVLPALLAGLLALGCGGSSSSNKGDDGKTGDDVRTSAAKAASANNMKQLYIGLIDFKAAWKRLPPAAGEPFTQIEKFSLEGFSWRAHILPYIEQNALYHYISGRRMKWDDPDMSPIKILEPPVAGKTKLTGRTFYRVFVGKGTAFDPADFKGEHIADKILIVEAGEAVPWAKPEELVYDADKPLPKLGGIFDDGFHVVFGDGQVRFIAKDVDEKILRAAIVGKLPKAERPGKVSD